MALTNWKVRADTESGRPGEARAPNKWFSHDAGGQKPYVRISVQAASDVFAVVPSGAPQGDQLIVAPGTFGLDDNQEALAKCEPLSTSDYRRHWILHTAAGNLTLFGLLLVAAGQFIQISLDIGEHWVVFDLGAGGVALAKATKGALTIGGATLAFWQGLIKG
ncbi:MAG: hypothetical protein JWL83_418 [Actinomycetia bacterium]|nr:hypothetical protein [Actinomycetes bacterium]